MRRMHLLVLLAGAGALLGAVAYAGAAGVEQAVVRVGMLGLVAVALIHLPVLATTGAAWCVLGAELPGAAPWKFIWARYVREATGEVLPFSQLGGIVAGARALRLAGVPTLPASATLLADVLIEQLAKIPYVLAGLALLLLGGRTPPVRVALAALLPMTVLGLAATLWRRRSGRLLGQAAERLARRWPALRLDNAAALRTLLGRLLAWDRRMAAAFAVHVLGWSLGAAETWVVFHLMGLPVSAAQAVIIDSLFCAVRTFGFAVPAALGVQEAGYVLVCAVVGVPAAPAVALSLVRRVRELLAGAPALGAWQWVEGSRVLARISDK